MQDAVNVIPCDFGNKGHCNALADLMNEYITDKMGGGEPYNDLQKEKLISGLRDHPSKLVLLAKSGEQFIGLVTCFVNFATFTVKPFINVHDIIVTQTWRNKGVGQKLLAEVINKARDLCCSKVTLEVREDNINAKYVYNKLGFSDAAPRQFYWTKYI